MHNQTRISPAQMIQHILHLQRKNKTTLDHFPPSPQHHWQTHVHNWKKQLRSNNFHNSPKLPGSPKIVSNQSTQAPPRARKVSPEFVSVQWQQEQRKRLQELVRDLRGRLAESQSRERKGSEWQKEKERLRTRIKSLQDQNFELIRELGQKSILIWKYQNLNRSAQNIPTVLSHSLPHTSPLRLRLELQHEIRLVGAKDRPWNSLSTEKTEVAREKLDFDFREETTREIQVRKWSASTAVQWIKEVKNLQIVETLPATFQKVQSCSVSTSTPQLSKANDIAQQTDPSSPSMRTALTQLSSVEGAKTTDAQSQSRVYELRQYNQYQLAIQLKAALPRPFKFQRQFQLQYHKHKPAHRLLSSSSSFRQTVLPSKLFPRLDHFGFTLMVAPSKKCKPLNLAQIFSQSLKIKSTRPQACYRQQYSERVIAHRKELPCLSTQTVNYCQQAAVNSDPCHTQSQFVQTHIASYQSQLLSLITISHQIYVQTPLKEKDTQTSHSSNAQPEEDQQLDFHWNFLREVEQKIRSYGQIQIGQNVSIMAQSDLFQVQGALRALINHQSIGRVNDSTCRQLFLQLQDIIRKCTFKAAEIDRLQSIFMAGVQPNIELAIDKNVQWIFDNESQVNLLEKQLQQQAALFKKEYEGFRDKLSQCLTLDEVRLVLQDPSRPFEPAFLDEQHKQQLRLLLQQYE